MTTTKPSVSTRWWRLAAALASMLWVMLAIPPASADEPADGSNGELRYFAVEIRTGPAWDAGKAPRDQAFFGEHSKHLQRLRDAGRIVMGARYADVGLLVVSARSEEAVRTLMDEDPSMTAGTFRYDVHAMNVFYSWADEQTQ